MKRRLFKTFVALLAIAAAATGPAWGQNSSPDVTLDFTTNDWGLPTSNTMTTESYTDGTYSITLSATYAYKFTSGYLLLGKSGSYLELPEFSSPVEKIEVVGNSAASGSVNQNIYVGGTAVSTQTTGAKGTNTYVINENYRAAGNIYTLKVENAYNTQITYIKVYYVSSGGGSTPEPPVPPTPHTVRLAEGTEEAANWSLASGNASVPGNQVLENVMSGSELTATYNGTTKKVKSVKAVKYVPPAATVTTAPTATDAYIEVGSTAALVNAGAANGGTMMYAVTTTNVQPASTADFSATRPTAQGLTAGTYYVWYYAKADANHSDSEIAGPVSVPLALTVTWNSSNISDLNVMGTFLSYTKEGITLSANANQNYAEWMDFGEESMNGIVFNMNESGGYTFTAPTGKQFTKIEMTLNNSGGWDIASLGTGWAFGEDHVNNIYKVTWKGSAATTVGLLTGAGNFGGETVKSIVFTLIDAQ